MSCNKIQYICEHCGKKYESYNKKSKFCSLSCTTIYYNKKRKGYKDIRLKCEQCKTTYSRTKGEINKHRRRGFKHHFCSKECSAKYKKGDIRPQTSESRRRGYAEGRIKPPMKYRNGCFRKDLNMYFRSSWEANFARILNYLNKKWEYEPIVLSMAINGKTVTYIPDFYLPDEKRFVEIKGYWHNKYYKQKFETFSKINNIQLIDFEKYIELEKEYSDKIDWEGRRYA